MDTMKILNDYIENRINSNINAISDDGLIGKSFEVAIRSYIMKRKVAQVKSQGKTDIRFSYNGKRFTCEIKTACGELQSTLSAQYVIYCPEVDDRIPAEKQAYLFNKEQWAAVLSGYMGRGKLLKIDSQRGTLHFQSFYSAGRQKASKPIRAYIDECCASVPTVEEFFNR